MTSPSRSRARPAALLALLLACACATTYDERVQQAQRLFYGGDPERAAYRLGQLRADDDHAADADLLRLEQAAALMAAGRHAESAMLMIDADSRLEILDYTSTPVADIADFLFAAHATDYRATPYEKLLLNALNIVNFLALGRPRDAAVEARRARLLMTQEDRPLSSPLAWSLAGIAFERAHRHGDARDAFAEAPGFGFDARPAQGQGSILVVVLNGKAPIRAELTLALPISGRPRILKIPGLVPRPSGWERATVAVDGGDLGLVPLLEDVRAEAIARYRAEFPRLLAAAVTQMVIRSFAADAATQGMREDARAESDGGDEAAVRALVALVATLFEAGLAELSEPDTRCWSLLPRDVRARRVNVAAGEHDVTLRLEGWRGPRTMTRAVSVPEGGLAVALFVTATEEGYAPPPSAEGAQYEGKPTRDEMIAAVEAALDATE